MKREGIGPPQKPSGSASLRYRIVEERAVTRAIEKAFAAFHRTDDAMTAVSFALEHDPMAAGFRAEDAPGVLWLKLPGKASIGLPEVTALYTVKGDEVNIRSIRLKHDGVIFHSAAFEREQ